MDTQYAHFREIPFIKPQKKKKKKKKKIKTQPKQDKSFSFIFSSFFSVYLLFKCRFVAW